MFIEPQQRFTIRKGKTTLGTGVFLEPLKPLTDEEKDPLARRKLMKKVIERLGFNPYGKKHEMNINLDHSKRLNDNVSLARAFEGVSSLTKN
jgi:hypothetical protein